VSSCLLPQGEKEEELQLRQKLRRRPAVDRLRSLEAYVLGLSGAKLWQITEYVYKILGRRPLPWNKRGTSTFANPAQRYRNRGRKEARRLAATGDLAYAIHLLDLDNQALKGAEIRQPDLASVAGNLGSVRKRRKFDRNGV